MIRFTRLVSSLIVLGIAFSGFLTHLSGEPKDVVVVANKNIPDSVELAKFYLQNRNIPEKNLILLELPGAEKISRQSFVETLHNPLLSKLVEAKLVDAILGSEDSMGRIKPGVFSLNFRYLVLCYGVPLHISEQPNLDDEKIKNAWFSESERPAFDRGRLAKNEASVDGELALLLRSDAPVTGFVPNPYYKRTNPETIQDILKVTRLDGPNVDAVKRSLNQAWRGEKEGLKGRAYIDEDGRSGGFAEGNQWMSNVAALVDRAGYSLTHDKKRGLMDPLERFDAPALYAGWYTGSISLPFTSPGFRFPPGAVAVHLHSFSAQTVRSSNKRWVGPLVDRGVSATLGNTAEPFLTFTHHLDAFFEALLNGWNFADAAAFALPAVSWQAVAIGDPLFRPFKVSLQEQIEQIGDPANSLLDQYVAMRHLNLTSDSGEMLKLCRRYLHKTPGPAVALQIARAHKNQDDLKGTRNALSYVAHISVSKSSQWGLFREIGLFLLEIDLPDEAYSLFRKLLDENGLSKNFKIAVLPDAIRAAERTSHNDQGREWRLLLQKLSPPDSSQP